MRKKQQDVHKQGKAHVSNDEKAAVCSAREGAREAKPCQNPNLGHPAPRL